MTEREAPAVLRAMAEWPITDPANEDAANLKKLAQILLRDWAAVLAQPVAAEGWQPIETAPMDRTEVLLWREDCGPFIGSYTSADGFPLTQAEIDELDEQALFSKDWFTQWPDARRMDGSEAPTHWRPLPPPPTPA